jgi:hypothetical protein
MKRTYKIVTDNLKAMGERADILFGNLMQSLLGRSDYSHPYFALTSVSQGSGHGTMWYFADGDIVFGRNLKALVMFGYDDGNMDSLKNNLEKELNVVLEKR